MFPNVEVRVRPHQPLLYLRYERCVTVRPVKGHLTPKINITFFIRNSMPNIFYSAIFLKKAVFSEKTVKNCFGSTSDYFLEKGGVLHQKLT